MSELLPDYTADVAAAVAEYWDVRSAQASDSHDRGVHDVGLRSEVTGGRHLDALQTLLVKVFVDAGIPASMMDVKRRPIPGYFRHDKSWDLVLMVADRVVGIIELKSMAGDKPGKNFNNRTDEALGQAKDVWTAVERGIINTPLRPWLGYFMLIEDNDAFHTVVKANRPVWPPDPAFADATYAQRYEIFFDRMVRERLLDAACLVLGSKVTGDASFPKEAMSFQSFAASIHGRCLQFKATNADLPW